MFIVSGQTIVEMLEIVNSLKIDFGSGYNPLAGYKTCDFIPLPNLDYWYDKSRNAIIDLQLGSVTEFYAKNVFHHIKDVKRVANMLYSYLKPKGILVVIEPSSESYPVNVVLDTIYYRWANYKPEIWFSYVYRDFTLDFTSAGFALEKSVQIDDIYIKSVYRKE